jgi:hypothetical protein
LSLWYCLRLYSSVYINTSCSIIRHVHFCITEFHDKYYLNWFRGCNKGIQSLRLIFFYIESCQYSMFYTNCSSVKFFIISYVFNLERRKYVAVWFFISPNEFNAYQHDYSYIHEYDHMTIDDLHSDLIR